MVNIIDDDYTTLDDDIERVQRKPTMYISYTGNEGVEHCAHEITNNMFDEHENENSVSDGHMSITYVQSENMIYFKDHGRGIPFEELEKACTILHSGTKMDREHGNTAGENGVGMTVTNAISSVFEITSTRNGEAKYIQFKDGRKVTEKIIKVRDKSSHGLLVAFSPSKYFMGADAVLPVESFEKWLTKISFFMNPGIKLTFRCEDIPGKKASFEKVYKNDKGISGYLPLLEPDANLLSKGVVLEASTPVLEKDVPIILDDGTITTRDMDRTINVKVAFNFNPKSQEPSYHAYCNDIENIQGGEHLNAVRTAITTFFLKEVNAASRKNDTTEYNQNDVLAGLAIVMDMNTDMSTKFESQTKHRLGNKAFFNPVKKLCTEALEDYFKVPSSKKVLDKIIEYIKFNAKLRLDISTKRKTVKVSTVSFMDSKCIIGYTPANNVNKKDREGLELSIAEGESAGNQVRAARVNNDIQGVLCLRGKPDKVYNMTPSQLMKDTKNMFLAFFDEILGCGFGTHFNMDALIYDKIIIMSDADVDGDHIASLLIAAIYKQAPQLITEGHVYRGVTPLYKFKPSGGKAPKAGTIDRSLYAYDKNELFDIFEKNVSDKIRLKFELDKDFVSSANMKRFLSTNRDYFQRLCELSDQYVLPMDIIEYLVMNPDTFKETIGNLDPELSYVPEDDCITGIYQGKWCHLILNKTFLDRLKYLTRVYQVGNEGIGFYHIYERKNKTSEPVYIGFKSIGQIMLLCQKYAPDIAGRYKGLGELSAVEMRELAMNPANRKLLQFTVIDAENTIEILDALFLDKNRKIRKELIQDADISLDDIDN